MIAENRLVSEERPQKYNLEIILGLNYLKSYVCICTLMIRLRFFVLLFKTKGVVF